MRHIYSRFSRIRGICLMILIGSGILVALLGNLGAVSASVLHPLSERANVERPTGSAFPIAFGVLTATITPPATVQPRVPIKLPLTSTAQISHAVSITKVNSADISYFDFSADPIEFTPVTSSRLVPRDILREIAFSGAYGGGGDWCDSWSGTRKKPAIIEYVDGRWVEITNLGEYEWNSEVTFISCGWSSNEDVSLTIEDSSGRPLDSRSPHNVDPVGLTWITFPEINTKPGPYTIRLVGVNSEVTATITAKAPQGPRMYRVDDYLLLYGLKPKEKVRLVEYRTSEAEMDQTYTSISRLSGWQQLQMDKNGQLMVAIPTKGYQFDYYAVGEKSGVVSVYPGDLGNTINNKIVSPYPLTVRRPESSELSATRSIWSLTRYVDLKESGVQRYNIQVEAADSLTWGFNWCATSEQQLFSILPPLDLSFWIDDEEVVDPLVYRRSEATAGGWYCERWTTVLEDWPQQTPVELEVRYSLDEAIFDGEELYPAGEYQQIIRVRASG